MNSTVGLYRHLDEMLPWNDRLQVLECIGVADEAPNVRTFSFRSDAQTWFRYQPGQFVTLELPAEDGPLLRTYTLASSPTRPFSIAVTVKMQSDSIGTRWMFENLTPGVLVKAYGPAGDFSLHTWPAAKYLFISAGSGITPMMSMLRWLNDVAPQTDVAFINCARRPDEIIFRDELDLLGAYMPGLSLGYVVEQRSSRQNWTGHMGRIDAARLPLLAPDYHEREVFCCGPDPFMRSVRALLEAGGFDMEHYHQESFKAPSVEVVPAEFSDMPASEIPVEPPPVETVPVHFRLSEVEAECVSGQTILQTARAAGVRIPAACEFGLCGTCKVKAQGPVDMNHNGGILDWEIEEGFVLSCCSKPLGPLVVEI